MKHLDWISAGLLLVGVLFLRYHMAVGWLFCAASCAVAIRLFFTSTYEGRPIWGKIVQSSVMLVLNVLNYISWR